MGQRAGVRAVLAALALLVGAGACEVDPNAPGRRGGGVGGGGRRTDVSGTWVYNVSNLSAAGVVCSAANFALSLQQQDSTFTGTYAGGEMVCVAPGEPPLELQGLTGVVINGLVRGDSVFFDLDTPDWHSGGRVSGNSISGETRLRLDLGLQGELIMSGTFGAVKQ